MVLEQSRVSAFKSDALYENTSLCGACLINICVIGFQIVTEVVYCLLKVEIPG